MLEVLMTNNIVLEVNNLKKYFPVGKNKYVHAVDGVSFSINRCETLGLVGESGCGKTTVGRTILRLIEADSGEVLMEGVDILKVSDASMLEMRKKMQIIFQDPFSSLDPRMNVVQLITEPLTLNLKMKKKDAREKAYQLMEYVGLTRDWYSKSFSIEPKVHCL
jgi:ABC-type oligopeptide transport system ATPase subunit